MRLQKCLALFVLFAILAVTACSKPLGIEPTETQKITNTHQPEQPNPTSELTIIPTEEFAEVVEDTPAVSEMITIDNAASLELITKLEGHTDRVLSLAVDNSGRLISGGSDNQILLWPESLDGDPLPIARMPNGVCDLHVSSDDLLLGYAFNHQANLWDLDSLELISDEDFAEDGCKGSFSPDGETFVTEGRGDTILFWDTASLEMIGSMTEPNGGGFAYRFSPDGSLFASSAHNGTVTIWDYESGEIEHTLKYKDGDMHDMEFSPDGSLIAAGSTDAVVVVWDVETGKQLHMLWHNDGLNGVAFSPDGSLLASASVDRTVRVWDVETGKKLATLRHDDELNDVIFSVDGSTIFSGGYDNVIYVWTVVEDL